MKLYTFFRSSASYRVRIALNLKGIPYQQQPIHLRRGGGEHLLASYTTINPQALVPALEDDRRVLTQSLAIIEYLDEKHPDPPLLPKEPADKALVRSMALTIAGEVHPIQNLRVLNPATVFVIEAVVVRGAAAAQTIAAVAGHLVPYLSVGLKRQIAERAIWTRFAPLANFAELVELLVIVE